MTDYFLASYTVGDGYVGGSRPQYFRIQATDLEDDMSDEELTMLFESGMQDHFEQHIFAEAYDSSLENFIEWARKREEKDE